LIHFPEALTMRRSILSALVLIVLPASALAAAEPEVDLHFPHRARVVAVAFTADGKFVATGGGFHEGALRLWEAPTGKIVTQFGDHGGGVSALAFTPDSKTLVSGGWDGEVYYWEAATGKQVGRLPGERPGITCVGYSPDGKTLAVATVDRTVVLIDKATGKERRRLQHSGTGETVTVFAFAPDGKTLAVLDRGGKGEICLWELANGNERYRLGSPHGFQSVVFSPDGKTLAAETWAEQAILYDPATGKQRRILGVEAATRGVTVIAPRLAFSPDGRVLALGSGDGTVGLFEVVTGTERVREPMHDRVVSCLAFSPDGQRLLTGSHDGTARLRSVRDFGPDVTPPEVLAAGDLDRLWSDLRGDAPRALQAIRTLAARPEQAVPFLAGRLPVVAPVPAEHFTKLIADLDDQRFAIRQKAGDELEGLGERAGPALRAALKDKPPLEVTRRIEQLLAKLEDVGLSLERVRQLRAIEVLERAGDAAAVVVLDKLSRGGAGVRETEEAKAALARLKAR
jgi:WD40 repeat protein